MKIYTVTENQVDYDDWPMGQGTVVLVTASRQRALQESSDEKRLWTIPAMTTFRVRRRVDELDLQDEPDAPYVEGEVHMIDFGFQDGRCLRCGGPHWPRDTAVCR